jgi:hypothetical protein
MLFLWSLLFFLAVAPALSAASEGARVVTYSKEEIVPVRAKVRFSTLIVLPDNEEILDFTTGDKEFWIVNGAHIRSNLNLISASGNVYPNFRKWAGAKGPPGSDCKDPACLRNFAKRHRVALMSHAVRR